MQPPGGFPSNTTVTTVEALCHWSMQPPGGDIFTKLQQLVSYKQGC